MKHAILSRKSVRTIEIEARGQPQRLPAGMDFTLGLVLSWPLLIELVRKYFWYSNSVYLLAELPLAAFVAWKLPRQVTLHRRLALVYFAAGAYLVLGCAATLFRVGGLFGAWLVGMHALVLPFLYLLATGYCSRRLRDPTLLASKLLTLWSVAILVVAALQVVLGPQSEINRLPAGLGFGVYTWAETRLENIFRPASIFMHTGKLGQMALTLALFKLALLTERRDLPLWIPAALLVDLAIVLLSGQRAAWALLACMLLLLMVMGNSRRTGRSLGLAGIIGGVAAILWVFLGEHALFEALIGRASQLPAGAASRLRATFVGPWVAVLDTAGLFGSGLGVYTSGSAKFGGQPLYIVVTHGLPEGSWHRILGETGLAGLGMFATMIISLGGHAYRSYRRRDPSRSPSALFFGMWLLAMGAWGFIHDVFADTTVVAVAYGIAGIGLTAARRGWIEHDASREGACRRSA